MPAGQLNRGQGDNGQAGEEGDANEGGKPKGVMSQQDGRARVIRVHKVPGRLPLRTLCRWQGVQLTRAALAGGGRASGQRKGPRRLEGEPGPGPWRCGAMSVHVVRALVRLSACAGCGLSSPCWCTVMCFLNCGQHVTAAKVPSATVPASWESSARAMTWRSCSES